ncbi:MAG: DNA-binding response regulator [Cellvibrionales bacterium]|nr:MAG: DNA-binding response regulator [Cellvibrionales bacterium]
MHKVLVVDDHELVRMGLCGLIESAENVAVIGECDSGEQALLSVRKLQPDIVFMDIRMPGMGGLEATRRLLASDPNLKIIIITALTDDVYPRQLLKAGAAGYITKSADQHEIQDALRAVMDGRVYVSPQIAQLIVVNGLTSGQEESPLATLSQRELQIAQMITNGHRVNEVAGVLNISPKTINTYKYRIFEKLGVSNDVELTLAAVKFGLVDPSDVIK